MAQKAAKQQAARNSAILKRIHLVALVVNVLYIVSRFLIFQSSCTRATYLLYLGLGAPAFVIEFWFERNGRPTLGPNGELKKPGDDLEAKGLTDYMNDVLYWTWATITMAAIFGDRAWWMYLAVPVYSVWLAYSTFAGVRQGMAGLGGQSGESDATPEGLSNRQKKFEKRGGQKVQYR